MKVIDLRPPSACSKTSRLKSSLFKKKFFILKKKLLHQESTCFKSSKSYKRDNYAGYTTCMHYRRQASIITQHTLEVDGMTLTGNQSKN